MQLKSYVLRGLMAKVTHIHKVTLSPLKDLLKYHKLTQLTVSNTATLIGNTNRVVFIVDNIEPISRLLINIKECSEKMGAENIRLITLDCILPQAQQPQNITPVQLCHPDTADNTPAFVDLVKTLIEFDAETYIIRMDKHHSALRRILLRTMPANRISLGTSLPFPYSNITITDPDALLSDYFK